MGHGSCLGVYLIKHFKKLQPGDLSGIIMLYRSNMTTVLIFHAFKPQVARNADHHPAFVAVYNMDTTEIVSFYQVHLFFILFYFFLGSYALVCWSF